MFHGVMGKDEREATSPSWFNPEEANEVVNWVTLLTRDKPFVKEKDIGIISPYAKQVQKIRMLLGANGTQDVSFLILGFLGLGMLLGMQDVCLVSFGAWSGDEITT